MDILSIAQWIFFVFVAGFIGYFGKYFGQRLIGKVNNLEKRMEDIHTKYDYKLEKKKLKQKKKFKI